MYTTFVLTRALDAKHISDERFIHSFTCAVHQTAFSLMYKLVHLQPTHDADNGRTRLKDNSAQDILQPDSHVPLPHIVAEQGCCDLWGKGHAPDMDRRCELARAVCVMFNAHVVPRRP